MGNFIFYLSAMGMEKVVNQRTLGQEMDIWLFFVSSPTISTISLRYCHGDIFTYENTRIYTLLPGSNSTSFITFLPEL